MKNQYLTQEQLKELFIYNEETGIFTRKIKNHHSVDMNKLVGTDDGKGYLQISISSKTYRLHRLAWLYVYGVYPKHSIDHINGIKNDNRICNLREANKTENAQNMKKAMISNKTSGLLGVCFMKNANKYIAQIMINGKNVYLGIYQDKYEAQEAYINAKRELHPFGEL